MSFEYIRKMPPVSEILESIPLTDELKDLKKKRDDEITSVFTGESDKFILKR